MLNKHALPVTMQKTMRVSGFKSLQNLQLTVQAVTKIRMLVSLMSKGKQIVRNVMGLTIGKNPHSIIILQGLNSKELT